jgi:peroxiredoxin
MGGVIEMKRFLIFCAILTLGISGIPAHAQKRSAGEQKLAQNLQLSPDATLIYLDSDGKRTTFDAFASQMNKHKSFSIRKDADAHTATLQILPPGAPGPSTIVQLKIKPGEALPAFALDSTHGRHLTNADLAGHYTLLSFYFATCLPCIAEIPALNAFARKHKDVHVLAVTYESRATARTFSAKRGLQWDSMTDAQDWIDALGVSTYPTLVLVDPDGHLATATFSTVLNHKGTATEQDIAHWVDQHRAAPTQLHRPAAKQVAK